MEVENMQHNNINSKTAAEIIQKEKLEEIYTLLMREFNALDLLDRNEDNEHRHEEMNAIRTKCKTWLDEMYATKKQRQDVTTYVIGNAKFLNYSDWVDEMIEMRMKYKSGLHIF